MKWRQDPAPRDGSLIVAVFNLIMTDGSKPDSLWLSWANSPTLVSWRTICTVSIKPHAREIVITRMAPLEDIELLENACKNMKSDIISIERRSGWLQAPSFEYMIYNAVEPAKWIPVPS